jgi:tRNA G10  N-methylase Trm11
MSNFEAKSICVLGRQPQLGLAELESLYGPERIQPIDGAALLDIAADDINFRRLGGTIKVARILAVLDTTNWNELAKYLIDNVPGHMRYQPEGKFTLGLSAYNLPVSLKRLEATLLEIKKLIRQTGKSARIVPNKALALNSAQVLHNKLTYKGAWELLYIKNGSQTILAQTLFVQDIEAYAARDQARPARDSRVGMLPPKLAQIMLNMAVGPFNPDIEPAKIRILDPFCGTGVLLQEALLMGYSVMGTDIDERLAEYTKKNLKWLFEKQPSLEGNVVVEVGDATSYQWPGFTALASEVFLGRPLNSLPAPDKLQEIISDVNLITKKFLKNLAPQLKPGRGLCLAVPAWRKPSGELINLPVIDQLTDMGYNYSDLVHTERNDLVYFREDQTVARKLLRLEKAIKDKL